MKLVVYLPLFLCFTFSVGIAQSTYNYAPPKQLNDGWKTSTLADQGIDSALFYKFFNQFNQADHKVQSMLLVKNNQLVLEEYFDDNQRDTQHDVRSVTKSFFSLLLGIAIDKGFIASVDDPIARYFPSSRLAKDPNKSKITIRHLITMSTGLDCNDWDRKSKGQEDKLYKKKDWISYTLDLPLINEPGKVSNYCSAGTILTAEIISIASGMPIDKFANKYLFSPMDINELHWSHTSNKEVIASGKRLYMRPRDMAKIGQLILQNGEWKGTQLISPAWIMESTSKHTTITGLDYGYLWWNFTFPTESKEHKAVAATGNGGQYIMIFPDQDLIAVFTGGAYNLPDDQLPFSIVNKVYLPSLR